ncbi:aryl-alcohol dehydrogenase [Mycobacterium intermedium]|uniref:Aryl-alcohol dehydrogenase n=1 Tax=Mycobacterium intermedium TaxID=28445 RepID=A0A1E3S8Q7_MYCIE|nr:NAD(P)-dependent alcohol dehydrogenase [Mycobacterium intermedium]MCV6964983.1 NAD(P)-dependent alcohol dehydrogenase [Mycobacterium intermedium]ODQ98474.1 aryl-alcohol dehydrogenase [Mycobacterium intermedium]OPE48851.1 aryl-alcohol dehydrogenase [Mycobacterium intermedium]ORA96493.1 aryl-alcohol dehydrogenase [Mycobacterium intermedium]
MKTTVALANQPGAEFSLEEVELDGPRDDEILVRIVATGLCHTDIHLKDNLPAQTFPRVLGHEGAGVVEAVGAGVKGVEVDDHVVLSFRSCRKCESCTTGPVGYCPSAMLLNYLGMRLDGSTTYRRGDSPVFGNFFGQSSLSKHAIAYADNCVVVDKSVNLTKVAPYGCGFQTGAGTVLNVLKPDPTDSLVVFGVGAVGLAAFAAAKHLKVGTLVAVDPLQSRRDAAAAYGAVGVDPTATEDVVAKVKELTGGGAAYAIDTTAISPVVKQAQLSLRNRGTLIALGLGAEEYTIDARDLLQTGKVIRSSIEGDADPHEMVPQLIELNAAGEFDVDGLIATYAFSEINTAVSDMLAGRVVKPVFVW